LSLWLCLEAIIQQAKLIDYPKKLCTWLCWLKWSAWICAFSAMRCASTPWTAVWFRSQVVHSCLVTLRTHHLAHWIAWERSTHRYPAFISIQINLFHIPQIHHKVKDHMDIEIVRWYKLYIQVTIVIIIIIIKLQRLKYKCPKQTGHNVHICINTKYITHLLVTVIINLYYLL
jgi:hypothetical protein